MRNSNAARGGIVRIAALTLALIIAAAALMPLTAIAVSGNGKVVRVGWYESPFNITDKLGRRSGFAYDYQRKIAAYTGWTYEYVEDSWPNLLQKLIDGEIDLLSDVSYTDERDGIILYSDIPMGSEQYYVFVSRDNTEITVGDYKALNGKTIAADKGSIQISIFNEWAKSRGISANIKEVTCTLEESIKMVTDGEVDAYLTLDAYADTDKTVPVCGVGSSDFYFAVNRDRGDLLNELNDALVRIRDENRFYSAELYEKYMRTDDFDLELSTVEKLWLQTHGTIRVGFQDNYLAFCAADKNGELTGALKDYLDFATRKTNGQVKFCPMIYASISDAMKAMKRGEVDCVFPVNLTENDAESEGVMVSPALMTTEMYAVVRASEQQSFVHKTDVTVAVNEGNINYEYFLMDHFPDWEIKHYKDTAEGLRGVSKCEADCVLISNYRYGNIAEECDELDLTTVSTGVRMNYYFAVPEREITLYSILAKTISYLPSSVINAALTYYSAQDAKTGFTDILKKNSILIVSMAMVIFIIITALLLRGLSVAKKANEGQRLITATENDELTGLYTRNFFLEYVGRMIREDPEKQMDAIEVNINRFHTLNTLKGHDFGDKVLCALADELRAFAEENGGIATRSGGDRFGVFCRHTDNYKVLYKRLVGRLSELDANNSIELRIGVMPRQKELTAVQQFHCAHTACNMARGNFKRRVIIYDEVLRDKELLDDRLMADFKRALEEKEFEVYYQPKYDIKTDEPKLISAEALVRWRHPEIGMMYPIDFISLLEQNGHIGELDKYVWEEAARQVARWRDKFGFVLPVSVNLSRVDVFDTGLTGTLENIIAENGIDRAALKLEITESAYTDNAEQMIEVIAGLRNLGYEIEMDDFGSGYSSLGMLSSMPVDIIKMDKSFIKDIENSERNIKLVKLILDIAENLKVPVIAEGVETKEQLLALKELGCRYVQGYYFSRPLSVVDFEADVLAKDTHAMRKL